MPNKNYEKGVRFEREIIKALKENGATCLRTAGSHGFADIVVITPLKTIEFIQAKVTESETTAERMLKKFREAPPLGHDLPAKVHQSLYVKVDRKGFRSVTV